MRYLYDIFNFFKQSKIYERREKVTLSTRLKIKVFRGDHLLKKAPYLHIFLQFYVRSLKKVICPKKGSNYTFYKMLIFENPINLCSKTLKWWRIQFDALQKPWPSLIAIVLDLLSSVRRTHSPAWSLKWLGLCCAEMCRRCLALLRLIRVKLSLQRG